MQWPSDPLSGVLHRMPYHIGVAARSFDRGRDLLIELFGLEFEPPYHAEGLSFMTPSGPAEIKAVTAHSLRGPMRVELCVGELYRAEHELDFHHYAYWSSNVATDIEELEQLGWTIEICAVDAENRPSEFAYLTKPGHPRIELVGLARREQYIARVGDDVPLHN
jgi:hypothetical protein